MWARRLGLRRSGRPTSGVVANESLETAVIQPAAVSWSYPLVTGWLEQDDWGRNPFVQYIHIYFIYIYIYINQDLTLDRSNPVDMWYNMSGMGLRCPAISSSNMNLVPIQFMHLGLRWTTSHSVPSISGR